MANEFVESSPISRQERLVFRAVLAKDFDDFGSASFYLLCIHFYGQQLCNKFSGFPIDHRDIKRGFAKTPISVNFRQRPPSRPFFCYPDEGRKETSTSVRGTDIDGWQCFEKRVYALPGCITKHHRKVLSSIYGFCFHARQFTNTY